MILPVEIAKQLFISGAHEKVFMTLFRVSNPTISQGFTALSESQISRDSLLESIAHQAGNEETLTAATMGSLFFKVSRVASLSLASQATRLAPFFNFASYGVALGAESLAFEGSHRALQSLSNNHENPHLWNWNGSGGLREGFTSTLFTIGSLKAFGALAQSQPIILQHIASDFGMVASQNVLGLLGWAPRPQGSAFEQFAHAEVMRLQLAVGGQLLRALAPSLSLLERNLEFTSQTFTSRTERAEFSNILLPEMAAHKRGGDGKTQFDMGLVARMAVEAEKNWVQAFIKRFQRTTDGAGISNEEIIRYLRFTQNSHVAPDEHTEVLGLPENFLPLLLLRRRCPAINHIYSQELGDEMLWAHQFESYAERNGLKNLRQEDCERYLRYKNWVDPRTPDINAEIAQDLRTQIELKLATLQRSENNYAGVYDRRDLGLEGSYPEDAYTRTESNSTPYAARIRDENRASNFERLWGKPGTVLNIEELKWYVIYCHMNPRYSAASEETMILETNPIAEQVKRELARRGVNVVQLLQAASTRRVYDPRTDFENQNAVLIDVANLGFPLEPPQPFHGGGEADTQAVTASGINRMLGATPPPAINPASPSAPASALALRPAAPVPAPTRSWAGRLYDATIGRLRGTSSPARPSRPVIAAVSYSGPFHFDAQAQAYRYRFPRGGRSTTIGRGWLADHRMMGDSQLSRKHITIQRRIEAETTAYILTAHNLTVIHRAEGRAPDTFDHGQSTWLNPGDRIVLTPQITLIFDPQ